MFADRYLVGESFSCRAVRTFTVTVSSIAGPPPDGEIVQFEVNGRWLDRLRSAVESRSSQPRSSSRARIRGRVTYRRRPNYLPATYTALAGGATSSFNKFRRTRRGAAVRARASL